MFRDVRSNADEVLQKLFQKFGRLAGALAARQDRVVFSKRVERATRRPKRG